MQLNNFKLTLAVTVLLAAGAHCAPHCVSLNVDCDEMYRNVSTKSGVYNIFAITASFEAYCDMDTAGGRWTVIQRRMDGTVNFLRPWDQYKVGFGNASGEYWLGLENLHLLTKKRKYELRVDMEDFGGYKVFAQYSSFSVASEASGYKLHVSGFRNGGAGDSLKYHNGMKFSTFDKDQDRWGKNCASTYFSPFWANACLHTNPNGLYLWGPTQHSTAGVFWHHWRGSTYSLKSIAMKIRPV